MPHAVLRVFTALALTVALGAPVAAHGAEPVESTKMGLVRQAILLTITSLTERDPVGLKLRCEPRSRVIVRCSGSWRDARAEYAGRFIAVDEGDAWTALFAGLRTDRACVKRAANAAARRACRMGVSR